MKVHVWRTWVRDRATGRVLWSYSTWCGREMQGGNRHTQPTPGMLEGATCRRCLRSLREVRIRELERFSRELVETEELLRTLEHQDARRRSRRERRSREAALERGERRP